MLGSFGLRLHFCVLRSRVGFIHTGRSISTACMPVEDSTMQPAKWL